jgi:hypothetical protein
LGLPPGNDHVVLVIVFPEGGVDVDEKDKVAGALQVLID